MNSTEAFDRHNSDGAGEGATDMKLEVMILPVSNVARAADFYRRLGWRVDVDMMTPKGRLLHMTPPGSSCSIMFGDGITPAAPGSAQLNFLIVSDIVASRKDIAHRGVDVGEVFHDGTGGLSFAPETRENGPDPARRSYASYVQFVDTEGNTWLLQEVTARFPGRIDSGVTSFGSASDLAGALRRAAAAHDAHEKRTDVPHPDWPDWYAVYLAAEQAGAALPT